MELNINQNLEFYMLEPLLLVDDMITLVEEALKHWFSSEAIGMIILLKNLV